MMMGFGFGGFGFMLLMLLFFVIVIGLAVWLVSALFPRSAGLSSHGSTMTNYRSQESPLDILKQRYARGELTKAEYEEMRKELRAS